MIIKPLTEKWQLPFAAVLIVLGFTGSEIMVAAGFDTGIRYQSFHDLIFYVFLPLLVFEAAFTINFKQLISNLALILIYALPLMLLSALASAGLIFYGIAHPSGFPWIAALLTGVLLSATDPVAVVSLMRRLGAPPRLCILLDGESLFNDATAIVTFSVLLQIALHPLQAVTVGEAVWQFSVVFAGGVIMGLVFGFVANLLLRRFFDSVAQAVVTLTAAYLSYLIAEHWLHVSGVMAVLVTGLMLSRGLAKQRQQASQTLFVDDFWQFNVFVTEALMFLFMGVTITTDMFTDNWLAMLIAIAAVLIARALVVFAGSWLLVPVKPIKPLSMGEQRLMFMGGLRGAVTLALALALPTELSYWWTIQSMAFGVVLFTLFVQAPLMPTILKQALNKPG
jgi:CPA1 family monovalent cation:H+ antiporter